MTIVNPASGPALDYATNGKQQSDGENQKQSWLRQLDLEQMGFLQQLGQQHDLHSAGTNASVSKPSEDGQLRSQDDSNAKNTTQGANLLPVHPILNQPTKASTSITNLGVTAYVREPAQAITKASSKAVDGVEQAIIGYGANGETVTSSVSEYPPINVGQTPLLGPSLRSGGLPGKFEATLDARQPASSFEVQYDSANSEWQKRLMHVAQEGSDISVSIRDADLTVPQSMQIVSRLANDAAQSGLRLKHATVNGKTIIRSKLNSTFDVQTLPENIDTTTTSSIPHHEPQE